MATWLEPPQKKEKTLVKIRYKTRDVVKSTMFVELVITTKLQVLLTTHSNKKKKSDILFM